MITFFYILSMSISQQHKKSRNTLHLMKKKHQVVLKIILEFFSTEKITKIIHIFNRNLWVQSVHVKNRQTLALMTIAPYSCARKGGKER